MGKNKLDIINFAKLYDEFGEQAARDTLNDVNEDRVSEKVLEKYLYTDETKEEFARRIKEEFKELR
ncbi:hypothetical protein [Butyrivibrio sp. MC2021]|uniref:hypothetical protein n=1 Tax=Butyrivibrio sp. MC2021 TaxID=1408306 RepID=UPI00047CF71F|nr:hypothetical protein [Butyrivibrio sp. MC2021]